MYQVIDYNYYTKKVIIRDDELGWQEIDYKPTYYKLDDEGYLLQLFTKPVVDRPTMFFEIIQRKDRFYRRIFDYLCIQIDRLFCPLL